MEREISILIIDDEPVARESLESALINQGYDLIFAHNGPEGIAKAFELMPDVILLDVMMPGMNGFEVCKRIREESLLSEVPIILVTALDDKKSKLEGLDSGADDFISKPFDRIELRARLRSITRLNRYRNLLNERSKTSWIIDHAKEGYLLIDQNGDISYCNKSASKYFASSEPEKLKGKNFLEQARTNYKLVPEAIWQNWPNGKAKHYLIKPETENSLTTFLQVDVFASDRSSQLNWLVSLRDITENTSLQNEVWKFHSIVSHKLRNPLTVVIGSLELLAQELSSQEFSTELVDMAMVNTRKLNEGVQSILSFVTSRNLATDINGFFLDKLTETVEEISQSLSLSSVSISIDENLTKTQLKLSSQAFALIIKELLGNSKKFHPSNSPKIEIEVTKANESLVLTFSDDGKNLSPEQLVQVWLPYYQAEKYFTGQVSGMGLGLTMIATLIWRIGGECSIKNRTNNPGIVVELVVPVVSEDN